MSTQSERKESDLDPTAAVAGARPFHLVVVESHQKCDTVSRLLEDPLFKSDDIPHDFLVVSCMGPLRELSRDGPSGDDARSSSIVGVDVRNGYEPIYEIVPGKEMLVSELRPLARNAQLVVLATDEDREGEALAWHLTQLLPSDTTHVRITFSEITVKALRAAFNHPHAIDMNLVASEELQQVLNRLGECTVSPILHKKVAPDLSGGREESLGIKLLVDRERERLSFQPTKYWNMRAAFFDGVETTMEATMVSVNGETLATESDFDSTGVLKNSRKLILTEEHAAQLLESFTEESADVQRQDPNISNWTVTSVQSIERRQSPPMPFTISTLQQIASSWLGMSVSETLQIAQYLYETGHITYMRTTSVHLSNEGLWAAQLASVVDYGPTAVTTPRKSPQRKAKNIQEPVVAIRPALQADGTFLRPERLETPDLSAARLYELIYRRTLASRMRPLVVNETTIDITGKNPDTKEVAVFRAHGSEVVSPGFTLAWGKSPPDSSISHLTRGQQVECTNLMASSHTTQPPTRYTEASLVTEVETRGLVRPGTYVYTVQALIGHGYAGVPETDDQIYRYGIASSPRVADSEASLTPSLSAVVECSFLERSFPMYVDLALNANMQKQLDEIALGFESDGNRRVAYLDQLYAGKDGLFSRAQWVDETLGVDDARWADLPDLFLNSTADEERIGLFLGPEGPYVQKLVSATLQSSDQPTTAPLPPGMAADISTIDSKALHEWLATREPGGLLLGQHPDDGRDIRLKVGRLGAYLLWKEDGVKGSTMHSLPREMGGMCIIDGEAKDNEDLPAVPFDAVVGLTLEDAVGFVNLPRKVCKLNGKPVIAAIGPYSPYLKYNHCYARLYEKDGDVLTVDADTAERIVTDEIINKKLEHGTRAVVAELGKKADFMVRVKEGRFAVRYLSWRTINTKLPAEFQGDSNMISLQQAWALLQLKIKEKKMRKRSKSPYYSKRSKSPGSSHHHHHHPIPARSAFLHFCEEMIPEITRQVLGFSGNLSSDEVNAEISRELARQWEDMAEGPGRRTYEIRAAADQARYKAEMREHNAVPSNIPSTIETHNMEPQQVPGTNETNTTEVTTNSDESTRNEGET